MWALLYGFVGQYQHNNDKKDSPPSPPTEQDYEPLQRPRPTARIAPRRIVMMTAQVVSRGIRYAAFCVCTPILLPFLCAAQLCLRCCCRRFRRRRRGKSAGGSDRNAEDDAAEEGEKLRRCEEGCGCAAAADGGGDQMGLLLLQRYLEDQLLLASSVYDCGDDADEDDGFESTPLLN